ncbi:hypothetical protein Pla123a_30250 [Posidoniimonas polymericola]|uniref:Uncharacterized protein n=1 Tax=Posidoniimonas polymericola TaxID=2528002 RepID=A0A5C5YKW6_9BACT|nr:hypothetical protein [Posidoniimonas polymericola]TWT75516.1 hypothetical protein Pla123a_30250 [Posidoniimonas polymericola]
MATSALAARTAAQSPAADDLPAWETIAAAVARSAELEPVSPAELEAMLGGRWTLTEGGEA